MTDVQHATPAPTAIPAESSNATGSISQEAAAPIATVPAKTGFEIHRERLRDRQADLDRHRDGVVKAIAKLSTDLEKVSEDDVNKRLGIRQKIKVFEDQLAATAEEQAHLDRQKDNLEKEALQGRIEEAVLRQRTLIEDGRTLTAKLYGVLALGSQVFKEVLETGDRSRIQADIIRSLAPERMTECPTFFSFEGCGLDTSLRAVVGQVFGELSRWRKELEVREQARVGAPGGVPTGGS